MKAVILSGGFGTRIGEETRLKPKPMIEIGGMPILWHIMNIYSHYNITDFIVCYGYQGHVIKEFFEKLSEPWEIKLVDTGINTMTGGRIKRIIDYLDNETFCLTYGDDLKNVNITELISFHRKKKKLATVTAAQPSGRFGILNLKDDEVLEILEKPPGDGNWINGGYYVLEPKILEYLENDSTVWERGPLTRLVQEGQVSAYKYTGIYQPLDTLQDKKNLEELWKSGKPYWKVWK